eukprot:scaffold54817_cov73-Phaeocystis_antarctica.AAC.6
MPWVNRRDAQPATHPKSFLHKAALRSTEGSLCEHPIHGVPRRLHLNDCEPVHRVHDHAHFNDGKLRLPEHPHLDPGRARQLKVPLRGTDAPLQRLAHGAALAARRAAKLLEKHAAPAAIGAQRSVRHAVGAPGGDVRHQGPPCRRHPHNLCGLELAVRRIEVPTHGRGWYGAGRRLERAPGSATKEHGREDAGTERDRRHRGRDASREKERRRHPVE